MVVFEGGAPRKADYRRFKIRKLEGRQDDFAAMQEVLSRRMARWLEQRDLSPHDPERDRSFASLPALVVIDGGKGQLSSGVQALDEFLDAGVVVVSLAKRLEEIYVPGRKRPIVLPRDSRALQLLQRIRDEAHRFAGEHHRQRRTQSMKRSVLDELPGVGPARKRTLLRHFGSPERFLGATREELEAVPGLPGKVARQIHEQLNKTG
jgi:excinuclease ABC subunit C